MDERNNSCKCARPSVCRGYECNICTGAGLVWAYNEGSEDGYHLSGTKGEESVYCMDLWRSMETDGTKCSSGIFK